MSDGSRDLAPGVRLDVWHSTERTLECRVEVLRIDKHSVTVRAVGQERTLREGDVLTISVEAS